MTEAEQWELDWWRTVFSTRFMPDNLPRPGTPLLGRRFSLVIEDSDTRRTWSRDAWQRGEM